MKGRWLAISGFCALCVPFSLVSPVLAHFRQNDKPDWCKPLPRSEYKSLEPVKVSDPWFEVYRVASDTFAIYEPHQSEETIGYLILGSQKAILLDTGMGISDVHRRLHIW